MTTIVTLVEPEILTTTPVLWSSAKKHPHLRFDALRTRIRFDALRTRIRCGSSSDDGICGGGRQRKVKILGI